MYRLVSHNQMGLNRLVCPGDSDPHLRLDATPPVHGVGQLHSRVPSMAGARESLVHVRAAHHCIIRRAWCTVLSLEGGRLLRSKLYLVRVPLTRRRGDLLCERHAGAAEQSARRARWQYMST